MAAFSRGLRSFSPRGDFICSRCLQFSTSPALQSGHNRWSKIKHDKGKADGKKNLQRSQFSRQIALVSKLYGGDPNSNPQLATLVAAAKKAGFPKASLENAIARGQGKSTTGAALESLTLEAIMPPSIATIIEIETDNKARAMMDLRVIIKRYKGTVTPTTYLFQKRGRLAFEKKDGLGVDEVLDEAIEAGAEDVESDEDGGIVVWTEPGKAKSAAEALQNSLGLKVESSDVIWDANEDTKVPLAKGDQAKSFMGFLGVMQDESDVVGVYANASQGNLSDEEWDAIEENLDA